MASSVRVLVFWSVENSERCVDLITRNVSALSPYPNISFAISHFDGKNDLWSGLAWYDDDARVVYKSFERGTKTYQWKRLLPEVVKGYDYLWMCDCDLGFERADLGVILEVLSRRSVWYCQTSIVGETPATRSTCYPHLRYSPDKPIIEWCPMWETTFPRNSHAGLGRPFYELNILTSMKHVRKVPTQSGVAISRKCCFPHGT